MYNHSLRTGNPEEALSFGSSKYKGSACIRKATPHMTRTDIHNKDIHTRTYTTRKREKRTALKPLNSQRVQQK
jgi:hypothetical protein